MEQANEGRRPYMDLYPKELQNGTKCRLVGICMNPGVDHFVLLVDGEEVRVEVSEESKVPVAGAALRIFGVATMIDGDQTLIADFIQELGSVKVSQYYQLIERERAFQTKTG